MGKEKEKLPNLTQDNMTLPEIISIRNKFQARKQNNFKTKSML